MPTVAEQLRLAREKQNLTVHQVAEVTKLKTDHVRSLEAGNYDVFAAPVYIRGFVRAYANLLKLDVPALMMALETELSQSEKFRETPGFTSPSGGALDYVMLQLSRTNWRLAVPIVGTGVLLLIIIFGYRTCRRHQAADPLATLGPGLYLPPQTNAGEMLPLPTNLPARK